MSDPRDDADQEALPSSYEDARAELADIVRRLESGGQSLEDSLALWERGEALAVLCQKWLDGARALLDGDSAHGGADSETDGGADTDMADGPQAPDEPDRQ